DCVDEAVLHLVNKTDVTAPVCHVGPEPYDWVAGLWHVFGIGRFAPAFRAALIVDVTGSHCVAERHPAGLAVAPTDEARAPVTALGRQTFEILANKRTGVVSANLTRSSAEFADRGGERGTSHVTPTGVFGRHLSEVVHTAKRIVLGFGMCQA